MENKEADKIGILTFHYSNNNFGALLQTYAIQTAISQLVNKEVKVIDFNPNSSNGLKEGIFQMIRKILGIRFSFFRNRFLNIQKFDKLRNLNKYFSTFVVGSDQVWRYRVNHDHLKNYFFDFVNDDKNKISYAASFGLDTWGGDSEITNEIKTLAQRFNSVSVREDSGIEICKKQFKTNSVRVLDSTLLIAKSKYDELIIKHDHNALDDTILSYMLLDDSADKRSFFRKFAKNNNLIFKSIKGKKLSNRYDFWIFNSIHKWLFYIKNSELVVTDSFHCVVFSIIFNKNFIVLSNPKRGLTRIENILKLIKMEHKLIYNLNEVNDSIIANDFNYEKINMIIDKHRQSSLNFLNEALKNI